jgi:RHS repeat-associated protein
MSRTARSALARAAVSVVESLEPRRLLFVPPNYALLEVLDFDVLLVEDTSTITLQSGIEYTLVSRGTITVGSVPYDAEYRLDTQEGTGGQPVSDYGLKANSVGPDWTGPMGGGPFYTTVVGDDQQLTLGLVFEGFMPPQVQENMVVEIWGLPFDLGGPQVPDGPDPSRPDHVPGLPGYDPLAGGGPFGGGMPRPLPDDGGFPFGQPISTAPVRFSDGAAVVWETDLTSSGFGEPWGHTRSWTNAKGHMFAGINGKGWVISNLPFLTRTPDGLAVVMGGGSARYFDRVGQQWQARHGDLLQLVERTGDFELRLPNGEVVRFTKLDAASPAAGRGRFIEHLDPSGNRTGVVAVDAEGRVTKVRRIDNPQSPTLVEEYLYEYRPRQTPAEFRQITLTYSHLERVTLRRLSGTGIDPDAPTAPWQVVRYAEYSYYDEPEVGGGAGNLKTASIFDPAHPNTPIDTSYYRYYDANGAHGFTDALKMVFRGRSWSRLLAGFGGDREAVFAASDAQVSGWADDYFRYAYQLSTNGSQVEWSRVSQHDRQQAGASDGSKPGIGSYHYVYSVQPTTGGYGEWAFKATQHQPGDQLRIVYSNLYAQPLLELAYDVVEEKSWASGRVYDAAGRLLQRIAPSGMTEAGGTGLLLVQDGTTSWRIREDAGVAEVYSYWSDQDADPLASATTPGRVPGRMRSVSLLDQARDVTVPLQTFRYLARDAQGSVSHPLGSLTQHVGGALGEVTVTIAMEWQGDGTPTTADDTHRVRRQTLTLPAVAASRNGGNVTASYDTVLDRYGRVIWQRDAAGVLSFGEYDLATGALVKWIRDVDTDLTASFTNLPVGWANSQGLHLATVMEADALGRVTRLQDPRGSVSYTVYRDAFHEVRHYGGWTGTATTGPTLVVRERRPQQAGQRLYVETLSMTATPAIAAGRPLGTESIAGVQSISRSYTNAGGQVVDQDRYFNLAGLASVDAHTLGTLGTHYYRVSLGYGARGLVHRVVNAEGTIQRLVHDGLDRIVSSWTGTDDQPTSGAWSPTNTAGTNLVGTHSYEYDHGGIGDGNLTRLSEHPGGSAADRHTLFYYDWRNQLTALKRGAALAGVEETTVQRRVEHFQRDNLGRVIAWRDYDGDQVTITDANADGVPDAPAASLLRAWYETFYDERGHVFRTRQHEVNPVTGAVGLHPLQWDQWFDARGQLIKTQEPGGLVTKNHWDSVGRLVSVYLGDGGGDSGYGDADDLVGDVVLQEYHQFHDAAGNLLQTTTKQRFHDETGSGALGNASSGVRARVSYAAFYHDLANRLTHQLDVGTHGGTAFVRPTTPPARSDTARVTSFAYGPGGFVNQQIDPRGIEMRFTHDPLGRVTQVIEAYQDGVPSAADDRTTEYTYNGNDDVLTMKALLPGTNAFQTTQYVYGVTLDPTSGRFIASHDLLAEIRYPDLQTGQPGTTANLKDSYRYNALAEVVGYTDRNNTAHDYRYDVLGRLGSDAVTAFGAGIDQAIKRLTFAFDSAGRPAFWTSRNHATDGSDATIVNRVHRQYNGFGQVRIELQEHTGDIKSDTPAVEYLYSSPASTNHSRLVGMIYPDGYRLHYTYAPGIDDRVSRLTAIAADNGSGGVGTHLEQYAYLGLGDVVRRVRPQPGTELTYLRQGAEPLGDAGDPYAGLDRFGQVVDQRWIHSASGVAFDRFQYGHDRNGNPLFKDNLVSPAHGELYRDAAGGYDPLDRLVRFQRGTLNAARDGLAAAATRTQTWSLDPLGNWTSLTTDRQASSRTHNRQNQITNLGHSHDANGNLTAIDHGAGPDTLLTYDAWDRLVVYQTPSHETGDDPRYAYDALHRRTHRRLTDTMQINQPTDTTRYFYSTQWQVIFEQAEHSTFRPPIAESANGSTGTGIDDPNAALPGTGGLPDPEAEPQTIFVKNVTGRVAYVWSAVYVDAMVLRDRDLQGDGVYDERLYVQQDANYNPASLSDISGVVVERFLFDPYGVATFLDPNWSVDAAGSDYAWIHLHQGGRQDPITGLVHFRFRDYGAYLGRWTQQDPAGYVDGANLYEACRSTPSWYRDYLGTDTSSTSGENAHTATGRQVHRDFASGTRLPNGRVTDRLDVGADVDIVNELKPHSYLDKPGKMNAAIRQLMEQIKGQQQSNGGKPTIGQLHTYNFDDAAGEHRITLRASVFLRGLAVLSLVQLGWSLLDTSADEGLGAAVNLATDEAAAAAADTAVAAATGGALMGTAAAAGTKITVGGMAATGVTGAIAVGGAATAAAAGGYGFGSWLNQETSRRGGTESAASSVWGDALYGWGVSLGIFAEQPGTYNPRPQQY